MDVETFKKWLFWLKVMSTLNFLASAVGGTLYHIAVTAPLSSQYKAPMVTVYGDVFWVYGVVSVFVWVFREWVKWLGECMTWNTDIEYT